MTRPKPGLRLDSERKSIQYCACGEVAFKKTGCGPVCRRCDELEHRVGRDNRKYVDDKRNGV